MYYLSLSIFILLKFTKILCKHTQYVDLYQGKLEVVKQEMARVNVNILGISELKWTGMGEFNSDDHASTTVGKNPLEEME